MRCSILISQLASWPLLKTSPFVRRFLLFRNSARTAPVASDAFLAKEVRPWASSLTQMGVAACVSLAVIVGVQQYNGQSDTSQQPEAAGV